MTTQRLPAVARSIVQEMGRALRAAGLFPKGSSECGLLFTASTEDQLPHIDNHYTYWTNFFHAAGNCPLRTTMVWNSDAGEFVHAEAVDGHWRVKSSLIHKGVGAAGWLLFVYSTIGFETTLAEITKKVPYSTGIQPKAGEPAPTSTEVGEAHRKWEQIASAIDHGISRGQRMLGSRNAAGTSPTSAPSSSVATSHWSTPPTTQTGGKSQNRNRRRRNKKQEVAAQSDGLNRASGGGLHEAEAEAVTAGPPVCPITEASALKACSWFKRLHDEMGFTHWNGGGTGKDTRPTRKGQSDEGNMRNHLLESWEKELAKIPRDMVHVGKTHEYGRGLFATRAAGKKKVLAIYAGNTFSKHPANGASETPESAGSQLYTMYAGGYGVSVTETQATEMFGLAVETPSIARCMGWVANHKGVGQHANARVETVNYAGLQNVARVVATENIEKGAPVILDYSTAGSTMSAQIDVDLGLTMAAVKDIREKYPRTREVPRTAGRERCFSHLKQYGTLKGTHGMTVRSSIVDDAGLGLFLPVEQLMTLINEGLEDIVSCQVGDGCTCLHIAAEDIENVQTMALARLPAANYVLARILADDSMLFAFPPSKYQMAAVFAANGSSAAVRYNMSNTTSAGLSGHLELTPTFAESGTNIVGCTVSIHAGAVTQALSAGLALGLGLRRLEVFTQGYGCDGSDSLSEYTENDRKGSNPLVPLMLCNPKDPHRQDHITNSSYKQTTLWAVPLDTAVLNMAIKWYEVPERVPMQPMMYAGRPTRMCDVWVWSVCNVRDAICSLHDLSTIGLSDVSWYTKRKNRTRGAEAEHRAKYYEQSSMRTRLARARAEGKSMITFGRGAVSEVGGKYLAVLYIGGTEKHCYTFPSDVGVAYDTTFSEKLISVRVAEDDCVWIQHAVWWL